MNNVVLTYQVPCSHMMIICVMPMSFSISVGLNKENNRLELDFYQDFDKSEMSAYIDIEPEKIWPLCNFEWWYGIDKYNLARDIQNIISSSLAEHLSGNTDDYGDNPAEIDLNMFEGAWELEVNKLLSKIISDEEKEKEKKKSETESHVDSGNI